MQSEFRHFAEVDKSSGRTAHAGCVTMRAPSWRLYLGVGRLPDRGERNVTQVAPAWRHGRRRRATPSRRLRSQGSAASVGDNRRSGRRLVQVQRVGAAIGRTPRLEVGDCRLDKMDRASPRAGLCLGPPATRMLGTPVLSRKPRSSGLRVPAGLSPVSRCGRDAPAIRMRMWSLSMLSMLQFA